MDILELITLEFREDFKGNIELGWEHDEAIQVTKQDIIEGYGFKRPYDNKALDHLNTLALSY